ncbi:MAG: SEC-C domain-containing protein [Verrucomicrobia bacterium]|nr:SEC-C domain-containing protein [Verrucomicrobiota bacterium]
MTKKVGRNDPCPCGSGKKYKSCCGQQGTKKKFQASLISGGSILGKTLEGRAAQISTNFFNRAGEPRKIEDDKPHHPPEADKPM